jgi:hypothetical protein
MAAKIELPTAAHLTTSPPSPSSQKGAWQPPSASGQHLPCPSAVSCEDSNFSPAAVNSATAGFIYRFTGSGDPLGSLSLFLRNPRALQDSRTFSSLQATTGAALPRVIVCRAGRLSPPPLSATHLDEPRLPGPCPADCPLLTGAWGEVPTAPRPSARRAGFGHGDRPECAPSMSRQPGLAEPLWLWVGPPPVGCLSLLGPQAKQAADPVAVATGRFRHVTIQGFLNFHYFINI